MTEDETVWVIRDWTCKRVFPNTFTSFDDAEHFLCLFFDKNKMDYEEYRQEYFIDELS